MKILLVIESTTEQKGATKPIPALDLYQSRTHNLVWNSAAAFWREQKYTNDVLDIKVLSPVYGLAAVTQELSPYQDSFIGQNDSLLKKNAELLGVPRALRLLLNSGTYGLCLFLTDRSTFIVSGLAELQTSKTPVLCICNPNVLPLIPNNLRIMGIAPNEQQARALLGVAPDVRGVLLSRLLYCLTRETTDITDLLCKDANGVLAMLV
jgi:hypothetical protein